MYSNKKHLDILESLHSPINEGVKGTDFEDILKKDPLNKKIRQIVDKYEYKLNHYAYIRWNEPYISISQKKDDYHPNIYTEIKDNKCIFEIQTVSYGSFDSKEYAVFLKGCNDAYNMVKELEKLDLSKLPVEPEDN